MIVRHLKDTYGTDREVHSENWISRRLLLADDKMGFSMHETLIKAGTSTEMHYMNHLEAVYCIAGRGEIKTLADGKVYPIEEGTIYALDQHDHHVLTGFEDMRMVCVFNPPVTGREVHDEHGAYPAAAAVE